MGQIRHVEDDGFFPGIGILSYSPDSYAYTPDRHLVFDLRGYGFLPLPDNAVLLLTQDSNTPLMHLNDSWDGWYAKIRVIDYDTATARTTAHDYSLNEYVSVGAIVDSETKDVYWVNSTDV